MTMPDEDQVPGTHLEPEQRDPEAPPEDALEQATPADPGLDSPSPRTDRELNEVNEWDAIEQSRVVQLEDDYR
jgi:hypothetical protein